MNKLTGYSHIDLQNARLRHGTENRTGIGHSETITHSSFDNDLRSVRRFHDNFLREFSKTSNEEANAFTKKKPRVRDILSAAAAFGLVLSIPIGTVVTVDNLTKNMRMSEPKASYREESRTLALDQLAVNIKNLERIHDRETGRDAGNFTLEDIRWIKSDKSYCQYANTDVYRKGYRSFDDLNYRSKLPIPIPKSTTESERFEGYISDLSSISYGYMIKQHSKPALNRNPSKDNLEQIKLLREYVYSTAGIPQNFNICIFKGEAPVAFYNKGKKILALNEVLFQQDFYTALKIILHEVAHEAPLRFGSPPQSDATKHDEWSFMRTLESLYILTTQRLEAIADKLASDGEITDEERRLLQIKEQWDGIAGIDEK